MADQCPSQFYQPVGDSSRIHDIGGHQKKRHGEQNEGVIGLEHLVHQQKRGQLVVDHEHRNASQSQGKGHRNPHNYENAENDKKYCRYLTCFHQLSLRQILILSTYFSIRKTIQVNPASGQAP